MLTFKNKTFFFAFSVLFTSFFVKEGRTVDCCPWQRMCVDKNSGAEMGYITNLPFTTAGHWPCCKPADSDATLNQKCNDQVLLCNNKCIAVTVNCNGCVSDCAPGRDILGYCPSQATWHKQKNQMSKKKSPPSKNKPQPAKSTPSKRPS